MYEVEPLQIILLTHEREVSRPTNTGQLAIKAFPEHCKRIIWARTAPDETLLKLLQANDTALLFPDEARHRETDSEKLHGTEKRKYDATESMPSTLVIIDATWQEARKMIRRSQYLKDARKYALTSNQDSLFNLRRNQVEGGLCTVECIIAIFKEVGMAEEAICLSKAFSILQK